MGNGRKHWFNLNESAFIILIHDCEGIDLEKSLLETWNVLRLFVNSFSADDMYSLISKENSMQTIQRHLSQKQKIFSQFFSAFSESALNFKQFEKKMTLIAYVFPNLPTTKDVLI